MQEILTCLCEISVEKVESKSVLNLNFMKNQTKTEGSV